MLNFFQIYGGELGSLSLSHTHICLLVGDGYLGRVTRDLARAAQSSRLLTVLTAFICN